MTKVDFIITLGDKLKGLKVEDKKEAISFYVELVDERIEQGMSEEEAINSLGSIEEIVKEILEPDGKKRVFNLDDEKIKKTKAKVVNESKEFYEKFKDSNLFTKLVIIAIIIIITSILLGFISALLPIIFLGLAFYLLYYFIKNGNFKSNSPFVRTCLVIILALVAIVLIPTFVGVILIPVGGLMILGITSLFMSGIDAVSLLLYSNDVGTAILNIGMILISFSLAILLVILTVKLIKWSIGIIKGAVKGLKVGGKSCEF